MGKEEKKRRSRSSMNWQKIAWNVVVRWFMLACSLRRLTAGWNASDGRLITTVIAVINPARQTVLGPPRTRQDGFVPDCRFAELSSANAVLRIARNVSLRWGPFFKGVRETMSTPSSPPLWSPLLWQLVASVDSACAVQEVVHVSFFVVYRAPATGTRSRGIVHYDWLAWHGTRLQATGNSKWRRRLSD